MVILLKRIKRSVASLVLLTFCCLMIEQLVYLVFVSGYGWRLLESPVLWSLFSVVCFSLLWRFNLKYPETSSPKVVNDHREEGVNTKINPATGFTMSGGVDAAGYLYGQGPSIR